MTDYTSLSAEVGTPDFEEGLLAQLVLSSENLSSAHRDCLVADGIAAAEKLCSARTRTPLRDGGVADSPTCFGTARRASVDRFQATLSLSLEADDAIATLSGARDCLRAVLKSDDTFNAVSDLSVRPYEEGKVKVASVEGRTVDLESLLDAEALSYAVDAETSIIASEEPVDHQDFEFYSDPELRDRVSLLKLILLLKNRGLICFRTFRRAIVGVFTVAKKDSWLRLIFDCRGANLLCRHPPKSYLSTPGALASLRIGDNDLAGDPQSVARPLAAVVGAIDLVDGFYLFKWERIASLFSLEHCYSSAELGITEAMDEHGNVVLLKPHDNVFACLSALPMGASWSLYFCHAVIARAMVVAAQVLGLSGNDATHQLVIDGRPSPKLGPNRPILAPYVDNLNVVAWDQRDLDIYLRALCDILDRWKLSYRIECAGATRWNTLGIVLDAERRLVYNKPFRTWRLRSALLALCAQGRCTGSTLRIVVGHLCHAFQLRRPLFSILWSCFRFINKYENIVTVFDDYVSSELRLCAALLPFIVCDTGAPHLPTAYLSDSSLHGYAVLKGVFPHGVM